MIQIKCPKCQMLMQTDDSAAGRVIACPRCGQQMKLGASPAAPPPVPTLRVEPLSPFVDPPPPPPVVSDPFAEIGSSAPAALAADNDLSFGQMVEEAKKEDTTNRVGDLWAEVPLPLPDEVERLGEPIDAFRSEGRSRKLNRFSFPALAIWAGVAGTAMVIAFRTGKAQPVLIVLVLSGVSLVVLLAVSFLQVGLVLLLARTYRILVFRDALVYQAGKRFQVIPWEAIEFVDYTAYTDVQGGVTRIRHSLVVATDDRGKPLHLHEELIGVDRLAALVLDHATRRQLGPALETVRRGQALVLGKFRLDSKGLTYREETYRWDEFDQCVCRKNRLCFRLIDEDDYCIEMDTAKVPRAFLVLAVARNSIPEDY